MLQTKVVEKIKTHFMLNNFFPKILPFYGTARQATDDNIIWRKEEAICMHDKLGKTTDTHL
jgi:hypothetical protein